MMRIKLLTAIFLILVVSLNVIAQDLESDPVHKLLTTESVYRCNDYFHNASKLIPKYYFEDNLDSVMVILNYWENKCGPNYRILRTRIVISALNGNFNEDLYDEDIINYMIDYRRYAEAVNNYGYINISTGQENEIERDYDDFITDLAQKALANYDSTSIEYLWGLFFTHDFDLFFDKLKSTASVKFDLYDYYYDFIESKKNERGNQTNYSLTMGAWVPTGNLNYLGSHPDLGFSFGHKYNNIQGDLTMSIRFLNSPNVYYVPSHGIMDSTDSFTEFYLGLDIIHEFAESGPFHFNFLYGGGVELLHTVDNWKEEDRLEVLSSFNINAGLGNRIYLNKYETWYINFYAKFNVINFDTKAGTDLSGNAATFGMTVGVLSMGNANRALKLLNFFD